MKCIICGAEGCTTHKRPKSDIELKALQIKHGYWLDSKGKKTQAALDHEKPRGGGYYGAWRD